MLRKYLEYVLGLSPKHMLEVALALLFLATLWAGGLQGVMILILFCCGGILLSIAGYRLIEIWWEQF